MRRLIVTGVAAAFLAAACGSDGSTPKSGGSTSSSTTTSSTTGSATGSTTTATVPAVQGTTAWTDVTAGWKALAPAPFAKSPELVAEDLATLRRGQDTSDVGAVTVTSVRRGEPAVVVLTETGGPDPAVVSAETEITLEPSDEGWVVDTARGRWTCFRAPADTDATTCS